MGHFCPGKTLTTLPLCTLASLSAAPDMWALFRKETAGSGLWGLVLCQSGSLRAGARLWNLCQGGSAWRTYLHHSCPPSWLHGLVRGWTRTPLLNEGPPQVFLIPLSAVLYMPSYFFPPSLLPSLSCFLAPFLSLLLSFSFLYSSLLSFLLFFHKKICSNFFFPVSN